MDITTIMRAYVIARIGRENSDKDIAEFANIEIARIDMSNVHFDFISGYLQIEFDDSQFGMTRINAYYDFIIEYGVYNYDTDAIDEIRIDRADIDIAIAMNGVFA